MAMIIHLRQTGEGDSFCEVTTEKIRSNECAVSGDENGRVFLADVGGRPNMGSERMHTISQNATATIHGISREVSEAVETVASVSRTMIGIVIFRALEKLSRGFSAHCRSADLWIKECAWI